MTAGVLKKNRADVFSEEVCNTGRQTELDIGKAMPILCLAFVHCVIECSTGEQLLSGIPFVFDAIIGAPLGAPMFMFCMGATLHFTRNRAPEDIARRGVKLLIAGLILNVFRFIIPFVIGFAVTGNADKFIIPLPYFFFGSDILQFAGIALLCIALFVKTGMSKRVMAIVALAMSVAGTLIRDTDLGNGVLNVVFGWIIGTVDKSGLVISYFPLLNWLIIPVCGYIFGSLLLRVKDKKRFYLSYAPVLLAAAVIYIAIEIRFKAGTFAPGENAYYHLLTSDALCFAALTAGLLGVYYAVSLVLPEGITGFFSYVSRHITKYFCIHWVFVRMITNVVLFAALGTQIIPLGYALLIGLGISIVTFMCLCIYDKFLDGHKRKQAA